MLLEVTVEKPQPQDAVWLISMTGELDFESAPRFTRVFSDASPPAGNDVVLDLSQLGLLDSSGLAAVLDLYLRLESVGAQLVVVSSRACVTRMFTLTAVNEFVRVMDTREQAVAALAHMN